MHSSAWGAADLMALRSFSSAARFSLLKGARYSSIVCGLADMACSLRDQPRVLDRHVHPTRLAVSEQEPRCLRFPSARPPGLAALLICCDICMHLLLFS